jgi:LytS/YehU family sensor histidine kinase
VQIQQKNEPPFKHYLLCQVVGWGVFLILRLVVTATFCAKRPDLDVFQVCGLEILDHLASAMGSHLVWRWMLWRRLFDKGWKRLYLEGFAAALLVSSSVALALLSPCRVIYATDFARVGGTAMTWFIVTQHALVMVLWFSVMLALFYFERTRTLEVQRAEANAVAREAQLHALKGQINPHFLFNSFNSLRALIDENPARAREAVTHLAVIMRYSLTSSERKVVPLSEELRVVNLYLDLEKLRLGDRLAVTVNVSPEAAAAQIPPLMLQGLVENAVKFGPAARKQGGEIVCSARIHEGRLHLRVTNPGRLGTSSESTGTGLKNLRDRLQLLYGDAAWFAIGDEDGARVVAEVSLPATPTISTKS